jgi:hypothetical protein
MNGSSTRRRRGLTAASVAGLALALAACGSNSPGIAHLPANSKKPTTPTSSGGADNSLGGGSASRGGAGGVAHSAIKMDGVSGANALKFAACVRAHGVPSFPDPNAQGVFSFSGTAVTAPQTRRAMQTCRSLLHLGGAPPSAAQQSKVLAQLLKYSQCMRSHGVTSFPDPTRNGGGVGLQVTGIDPNSPIFQRAQKACGSLQPGGAGSGP